MCGRGPRRRCVRDSATVALHKFSDVEAFVVIDLDGADVSAGIVRCAPKVLQDGTRWLARSATYQFASIERRISGASAGINAPADAAADAIAAFVTEAMGDGPAASVLFEPGRGVGPGALSALRDRDPRPDRWWELKGELVNAGAVEAAARACGGLDGRTVAIEGFDGAGPSLVTMLAARGARVVAVSTAKGTLHETAGIDADDLVSAWSDHGAGLVSARGSEPVGADAVFGVECDLLFVGSKVGVLDDSATSSFGPKVVVPTSAMPVATKALASLGRAGVVVLPDFVTTAGHLAAWPESGDVPADVVAAAADLVGPIIDEVLPHASGPLLGACELAEAFLLTWNDALPFGRPIA